MIARTILITGATDGLGRRVAERLASPDALLLVHGRNAARGRAVVDAVEAAGGSAHFYEADFASLQAVRQLAETIARTHPQIDVVINNAGIAYVDGARHLSQDGYELHFAVNYLATFLLTELLRPSLGVQRASRVINVASAGQSPIDFANVMLTSGYDGFRAYAQSKLADIMYAFDLADDAGRTNIIGTTLHPGTYMDTQMVRTAGIAPITSVETGAQAVLALVHGADDAVAGRYFDGMQAVRANAQAYDTDARRRLHRLSVELTGLDEQR